MERRVLSMGWGLALACVLGLGLFMCGDPVAPHHLTCTDLVNMPIEDLMEVNIVSQSEGQGRPRTPGAPSPSALLEAPFTGTLRSAALS